MSPLVSPGTIPQLIDIVRSTPRLMPVGNETKPRLSTGDVPKLSVTSLKGILEYEPGEFTFTALAGTPLREIIATLEQRGQFLPFDPPLAGAGATLGGTVGAGLSGPGRLRFGGVRDFILGVKFVDGRGEQLRLGGKVVKNAAGFDLPKFFVGSCGRFGVLVEFTFKVFPLPSSWLTLKLEVQDLESASRILIDAAISRWEPYALDLLPGGNQILLKLGGPVLALEQMAIEILTRWPGSKLSADEADLVWSNLKEFQWAFADGALIKIPITPKVLPGLIQASAVVSPTVRIHASSGGNVAFISFPKDADTSAVDAALRNLRLNGLTLRGPGPLWYGHRPATRIASAVKTVLDPVNRFPSLDS